MAELTLDEARDLLMTYDVLPMSQGAQEQAQEQRDQAQAIEGVGLSDTGSPREDEVFALARTFDSDSVGLGVDIVEIERMQNILARRPEFAQKVFSPDECAYCTSRSASAAHYAVRFAAKEAVVKALGTGFTEGIGVRDIEVERARNGRPVVVLSGVARQVAERLDVLDIALSMSYTKVDAVACALAITRGAVVATEARKDPMEELTRQFKEARKMLDEL